MRLQPDQPDGFVNVARCLVKLGRIAEINAALLATVGTARPSVGKWRGNSVPHHRAAQAVQEASASL